MARSELEAKIAEAQNWKDVGLFLDKYTGSAITENGEKVTIDVTQTSGKIHIRWKNPDGTEGESEIAW